MTIQEYLKKYWDAIRSFFPFVLLFSHLKFNLLGLLYWAIFFGIVTDNLGSTFGISYLFLSPEYQGEVSWLSFLLLGFSFGGLTMAFHSYSYVRMGPHFSFLATVHKPFVKFCLNNSILPTIFTIVYVVKLIDFQKLEEFASTSEITSFCISFLVGVISFVSVALLFFFPSNKNIFDILSKQNSAKSSNQTSRWMRISQGKTMRYSASNKNPLYWYIGKSLKIHQCRSTRHYSAQLLLQVFAQNRISTTLFEVTTVCTFVVLGLLGGSNIFDVPAAMSVVMLLTIVLMLFSALISWLKNWTYLMLISLLLFMNFASRNWGMFQFENQAYGLNYNEKSDYNLDEILRMSNDLEAKKRDSLNCIEILNNWKSNTHQEKPVLLLINTSGGGSRSATWVFEVLRYCDSLSKGQFLKNTALITGASGGMIGASYYRSLKLKGLRGETINFNRSEYYNAISDDLLNKLAFAASTNDIFFRYQSKIKKEGAYNYDRGMAFEIDLNENTKDIFDVPLSYYEKPEKLGHIPTMIFSPTIVNDGRRLLVSAQPLSYITANQKIISGMNLTHEHVDIHQLLAKKNIDKLRFSSVLRMNATFPFVLPMVTMPTNPAIQLIDAGSRDNFGIKTSSEWLFAMQDWIKENTAGVVILEIRDTKNCLAGERIREATFLDKFSLPVTNVFKNFPRTQDFDQEQLLRMGFSKLDFPIQLYSLNLREITTDRISLSWHLTAREKIKIKKAIHSEGNNSTIRKLMKKIE